MDSKLTPLGIKHSHIIARKLKNKKIDLAYRSRLTRSAHTLEIVLKNHPECKSIIIDNRIIERSYGKLQRKFHKTIIQNFGRKQFYIWHRSYDTPPPEGESIKNVEKRVYSFIIDLIKVIRQKKVNVAVSAHGNSMRPFRRYFEKFTIEQMMELENPFDKYFDYIIEV